MALATSSSPAARLPRRLPDCGAPVEFRSAAAPFAVCSFCRSTVVRAGDQLRKIGESAEVFDDHTPLQLGAAGSMYQGANFTIVGRLQYRYARAAGAAERMARPVRERPRAAEIGLALR